MQFDRYENYAIKIFKHLHKFPELSFLEYKTKQYIKNEALKLKNISIIYSKK
jgi:metal-dependent amidase/aminoacylase/carboxypeptidase family protein